MKFLKTKSFKIIILIVIIILAFGLRLKSCLTSGAWLDEASVYTLTTGYDFQHLLLLKHWDVAHPPLLYLSVRFLIFLNNFKFIPIIYLRIPFVIFSSLAVIPIYLIAFKIIKNKFALFIPLWYAIHPFQILMGYSMRPYGLLQFLFPIALFAFFKESWNKKWKIIFWNIFFVFLFFWDYASLWFFGPLFLYMLLFRNKFSFKSIIIILRKTWIFWILVIGWLCIFLPRINEVFILTNYTKTSLFEAFLIINIGTWSNIIEKNYVFLWSLVFVVCLLININNTQKFLFLSLSPLIIAGIISKFISPMLITENLIYVSLIFLIIYGMVFKNTKKLFKLFFGIIFSLILLFHLTQTFKFNRLSYPSIDLPIEQINFIKSGNYIFLSYNEYLQYIILYNLLRSDYLFTTNTYNSLRKNSYQIAINSFNLKDAYQKMYLNKTSLQNTYKYFVSFNQKYFSNQDKQIISEYCQITDKIYDNFENNQISFVLCQ